MVSSAQRPKFFSVIFGVASIIHPMTAIAQDIDYRALQYMLDDLGYDVGPIDGVAGSKTKTALKSALPLLEIEEIDEGHLDAIRAMFLSKHSSYSAKTSADRASFYGCRVKTSGGEKLLFAHHQLKTADGVLFDGEHPKNPWFSDTYAIADLQGDGSLELINPFHSMNSPNLDLPIFVWSESKVSISRVTPWGMGGEFGIEQNQKLVDGLPVADFNRDGVDDIAVIDYGEHDIKNHRNLMDSKITIFNSSKSGMYVASEIHTPKHLWHRGVSVDLNYDGFEDILVTGGDLRNTGFWTYALINHEGMDFKAEPFLAGNMDGTWAVSASDIDQDGFADIIVGREGKGARYGVEVFWGGSDYRAPTNLKFNHGSRDTILDFTFGDYNGDGSTDIAVLTARNGYKSTDIDLLLMEGRKEIDEKKIFSVVPKWDNETDEPQGMNGTVSHIFTCNNRVTALMLAMNAGFTDFGNAVDR